MNKLKLIFLFYFLILTLTGVYKVLAAEVLVEKVCLSGLFWKYTDCDSGKSVSNTVMKMGRALNLVANDKKSFRVATVGGTGTYDVYAKIVGGSLLKIGAFDAMNSTVTLLSDYVKQGWVAKGRDVYTPASGIQNPQNLSYPIAELGNCKDQATCKAYCEGAVHINECVAYGEKNNLITPEQAKQAKEFQDVLKGGGPGACKDENSCKTYCNDLGHLDECLLFAEKHKFLSADELKEAKQVAEALKNGGKLPGSCTDKKSCESYCKDTAHAGECLDFAKKAGFISAEEAAQAEKVIPLIQKGESPGKCKNKAECEAYCANGNHLDECIVFAEKAGLISAEELTLVKKTGGKGPGNCNSKASCDTYCNKSENQKECFDYAKEHDLIPADKLKEIQDSVGRLRAGIAQAPESAVACLKDSIGQDIVQKVEDGSFLPGPVEGEKIQACFEGSMAEIKAKFNDALKIASPEVLKCLDDGLGADGLAKVKDGGAPTPEMGDVMKKCFQIMQKEGLQKAKEGLKKMPEEMKACVEDAIGKDTVQKIESGEVTIGPEVGAAFQKCASNMTGVINQKIEDNLKGAPAEIRDCIKDKIGDVSQMMTDSSAENVIQQKIQSAIQDCMANFKPQIPEGGSIPKGMNGGIPANIPTDMRQYIPEGIPSGMMPNGQNKASQEIPKDFEPDAAMCAAFKAAPSCDYVPESARDLCEKCK